MMTTSQVISTLLASYEMAKVELRPRLKIPNILLYGGGQQRGIENRRINGISEVDLCPLERHKK